MIVRRRDARLVVDVREHLEFQLRVFVQDLEAAFDVVAAILLDEVLVAQKPLEIGADLLAAGGAGVVLQRDAAVGDELIEFVGHGVLPARIGGLMCHAGGYFPANPGGTPVARRISILCGAQTRMEISGKISLKRNRERQGAMPD